MSNSSKFTGNVSKNVQIVNFKKSNEQYPPNLSYDAYDMQYKVNEIKKQRYCFEFPPAEFRSLSKIVLDLYDFASKMEELWTSSQELSKFEYPIFYHINQQTNSVYFGCKAHDEGCKFRIKLKLQTTQINEAISTTFSTKEPSLKTTLGSYIDIRKYAGQNNEIKYYKALIFKIMHNHARMVQCLPAPEIPDMKKIKNYKQSKYNLERHNIQKAFHYYKRMGEKQRKKYNINPNGQNQISARKDPQFDSKNDKTLLMRRVQRMCEEDSSEVEQIQTKTHNVKMENSIEAFKKLFAKQKQNQQKQKNLLFGDKVVFLSQYLNQFQQKNKENSSLSNQRLIQQNQKQKKLNKQKVINQKKHLDSNFFAKNKVVQIDDSDKNSEDSILGQPCLYFYSSYSMQKNLAAFPQIVNIIVLKGSAYEISSQNSYITKDSKRPIFKYIFCSITNQRTCMIFALALVCTSEHSQKIKRSIMQKFFSLPGADKIQTIILTHGENQLFQIIECMVTSKNDKLNQQQSRKQSQSQKQKQKQSQLYYNKNQSERQKQNQKQRQREYKKTNKKIKCIFRIPLCHEVNNLQININQISVKQTHKKIRKFFDDTQNFIAHFTQSVFQYLYFAAKNYDEINLSSVLYHKIKGSSQDKRFIGSEQEKIKIEGQRVERKTKKYPFQDLYYVFAVQFQQTLMRMILTLNSETFCKKLLQIINQYCHSDYLIMLLQQKLMKYKQRIFLSQMGNLSLGYRRGKGKPFVGFNLIVNLEGVIRKYFYTWHTHNNPIVNIGVDNANASNIINKSRSSISMSKIRNLCTCSNEKIFKNLIIQASRNNSQFHVQSKFWIRNPENFNYQDDQKVQNFDPWVYFDFLNKDIQFQGTDKTNRKKAELQGKINKQQLSKIKKKQRTEGQQYLFKKYGFLKKLLYYKLNREPEKTSTYKSSRGRHSPRTELMKKLPYYNQSSLYMTDPSRFFFFDMQIINMLKYSWMDFSDRNVINTKGDSWFDICVVVWNFSQMETVRKFRDPRNSDWGHVEKDATQNQQQLVSKDRQILSGWICSCGFSEVLRMPCRHILKAMMKYQCNMITSVNQYWYKKQR